MSSIKTIKLSTCEVDIKTSLTWGENEQIQAALLGGVKVGADGFNGFDTSSLLNAKYRLLEIAVVEVRINGEGRKFTQEWMDGLSMDDGNNLYSEVENLNKKKEEATPTGLN